MTMKLIEYTDETPPRKRACINCGLRDLWALGADADTTGITSGIVIRGTSGASTGARTGERRESQGVRCGGGLMEQLKPCPFCGGNAKMMCVECMYFHIYWARCTECNAEIKAPETDVKQAIDAWNRRANDE